MKHFDFYAEIISKNAKCIKSIIQIAFDDLLLFFFCKKRLFLLESVKFKYGFREPFKGKSANMYMYM